MHWEGNWLNIGGCFELLMLQRLNLLQMKGIHLVQGILDIAYWFYSNTFFFIPLNPHYFEHMDR